MKVERIPLLYPCGAPPEAGIAKEIAPGVIWLRMPLPLGLNHINLWAIQDREGWAIFDTGIQSPATEHAWRTLLGSDTALGSLGLSRLFATHMHPDHIGLAGWLNREFSCELWMTRGEYLSCRVLTADTGREAPSEAVNFYRRAGWGPDAIAGYRSRFGGFGKMVSAMPESYRRLQEGERLCIGDQQWQVIIGSGHSPEHACFYCPALKLLISGDQVLPRISSNVSVYPTEPHADPMDEWLRSLDKLKRLVPDDVLVLPAHDDPFHGLHARLDHLAGSHQRGLDRLLQLLKEGPKRAVDVFGVLFSRPIDDGSLSLATGESLANLNHLLQQGRITVRDDEEGVAWYCAF